MTPREIRDLQGFQRVKGNFVTPREISNLQGFQRVKGKYEVASFG